MNKTESHKWAAIVVTTMISTFWFAQIANAVVPPEGPPQFCFLHFNL